MTRSDRELFDRAVITAALDRQRARNPRPPSSGLSVCPVTSEGRRCSYITGHDFPHSFEFAAQERQQLEDAIDRAREERGDHQGPEYRREGNWE